jgi:hypothetical protein
MIKDTSNRSLSRGTNNKNKSGDTKNKEKCGGGGLISSSNNYVSINVQDILSQKYELKKIFYHI